MKSESFDERKLYSPRDFEGKPNAEALRRLRDLERDLKNSPSFIGLVPRGSRIKGYSAEGSDIDVLILFDSSKMTADETDFYLRASVQYGIHCISMDMNLERLLSDLRLDPRSDGAGAAVSAIAALTELVSGHRAEIYRNAVRHVYNGLSKEARAIIKNRVIDLLMRREAYGVRKSVARKSDGESAGTILGRKRGLWEKRFERIWHANEN